MEVLIFLGIIIAIVIASVLGCKKVDEEISTYNDNKEINKTQFEKWVSENNLPLKPQLYLRTNGIEVFVFPSEEKNKLFIWENYYYSNEKNAHYLTNIQNNNYSIDFCELTKIETIIKTKTSGPSTGDVIVGGLIAGNIGVASAMSKDKKEICEYKVSLYTTNITNPVIDLHLINYASNTAPATDENLTDADEFAHKLSATVNAITSKQ